MRTERFYGVRPGNPENPEGFQHAGAGELTRRILAATRLEGPSRGGWPPASGELLLPGILARRAILAMGAPAPRSR